VFNGGDTDRASRGASRQVDVAAGIELTANRPARERRRMNVDVGAAAQEGRLAGGRERQAGPREPETAGRVGDAPAERNEIDDDRPVHPGYTLMNMKAGNVARWQV